MAKNKKTEAPVPEDVEAETAQAPEEVPEGADTPGPEEAPEQEAPKAEEKPRKDQGQLLAEAADKYLRLAAEYDNYRKRTAKEKEAAWGEAKAQTVAAFLPVFDNLERAMKQETADEAYKKGVEMTMKGLQDALAGLGVEMIPALGETFDPNRHNAVMHCDDPEAGENTIVEIGRASCRERV